MATTKSKTTASKATAKGATQTTQKAGTPAGANSTSPAAKNEEKPAAAASKATETKTAALKETAKKPGRPASSKTASTSKKTATRRPSTKKIIESAKTEVVVEYGEGKYSEADMMKRVVKAWEADGRKATAVKKISIYVQPENNKIYFVINEGLKNEMQSEIDMF